LLRRAITIAALVSNYWPTVNSLVWVLVVGLPGMVVYLMYWGFDKLFISRWLVLRYNLGGQLDGAPNVKPGDVPNSPQKDDDWKDKFRKFWQEHKAGIFVATSLLVAFSLGFWYSLSSDNKRDPDPDSYGSPIADKDSPRTSRIKRLQDRAERRFETKQEGLAEVGTLERLSVTEGFELFALVVIAVGSIQPTARTAEYIFTELKQVFGFTSNVAERAFFFNIRAVLLDPELGKVRAGSTVAIKSMKDLGRHDARVDRGFIEPDAPVVYINTQAYKDNIVNTWLGYASGLTLEQSRQMSAEEFGEVVKQALTKCYADPATHALVIRLANVIDKALPFCTVW
jgi:hypothetical protein